MRVSDRHRNRNKKAVTAIIILIIAAVVTSVFCLFVGSSRMSVSDALAALFNKGTSANIRIIWNIRIPRVLAAIIAGAGLSVSGLIMQTTLNNSMASPSTLGVSNAAVFGANLSIIAFAGGFLSTGNNVANYAVGANPYATSVMAFIFSTASILLVLALCKIRAFSHNVVVLAGIAIGSVWTAATTVLFPDYLRREVACVVGVDISAEMAKIAAEKHSGEQVRVICADVQELEFEEKFDCVMIYNAFPHFPEPRKLFAHLAGALLPGGRITVAHGMSREKIDAHHHGHAKRVSMGLMHETELMALMGEWFAVDIAISDSEKYIVSGMVKEVWDVER